jgi:hypothetical protein
LLGGVDHLKVFATGEVAAMDREKRSGTRRV